MSIPKRKFREMVFQLLYSQDIDVEGGEETIPLMMDQLNVTRSEMRVAYDHVVEIKKHFPEIDQRIGECSEGYAFDRIQRVEKNILRLGFYELYFKDGIPPKVVIAEAIRLAKKFSTPESVKFVNAILDRARKNFEGDGGKDEDKLDIYWNAENNRK